MLTGAARPIPGLRCLPAGTVSAAFLTVADQLVVSGGNVLLGILLARWLARPEFGAYSVLFASYTLVLGIHNAILIEPFSVFSGGLFRESLAAYVRHCLALHAVVILAIIPFAGVLGMILPETGRSFAFAFALVLGASFTLLYLLLRRVAYTLGMRREALFAGVLNFCATVCCLAALRSAEALFWAAGLAVQAAGGCAGAIVLWRLLAHSGLERRRQNVGLRIVAGRHWAYGRWALLTVAVFWLSAEAYSVLVARILGNDSAAAFRAVLNLTMLLPNFLAAIGVLILPRVAGLAYDCRVAEVRLLTLQFLVACLIAAAAVAVALGVGAAGILRAVYGEPYASAAKIMPPLLLNMILLSGSQALQTRIRAMNEPRRIFQSFLVAAVCTCTLGVALTHRFELQGAAFGLCCSTLGFVVMLGTGPRVSAVLARAGSPRRCRRDLIGRVKVTAVFFLLTIAIAAADAILSVARGMRCRGALRAVREGFPSRG